MSIHSVTAQAHPNIAFIKYSGEKLDRTNGAGSFRLGI
jgi:mevalonate pyrophosphate decarboxylase